MDYDISQNNYSIIRMAIRDFCRVVGLNNDYKCIDESVSISNILSVQPNSTVKAGEIRKYMTVYVHPESLIPLKEWCNDLQTSNIDWVTVFNNIFTLSNNYKLIQFQYKLLLRISTSRYMRFKMGIVRDHPNCLKCSNNIETLTHIFIKCPHTKHFLGQLRTFILLKIDPSYRDNKCSYFLVINHSSQIINYLNMVAKWYISKQFHKEEPLSWQGFKRLIQIALHGEKESIKCALMGTMF